MRRLTLPTWTLRAIDRAWLAGLGLLACGPTPATTDGPDTDTGSAGETTTVDPSGPTSTGPTSTGTTGTTDTTDTGGPAPECESFADCSYCHECQSGQCVPVESCCQYATGLQRPRCNPDPDPGDECFTDDDCFYDYVCEDSACVADLPQALPSCAQQPIRAAQWDLTDNPGAFGLADLDGDGDLDLFAALPASGAIELAFNDGAGSFTGGTLVEVGGPQAAMHATAADLDGDGDSDLAVAAPDSGELVLLFGQDGAFTPGPVLTGQNAPWTVTAADVNLDGHTDLVTVGVFLGVSVWSGDGLGEFAGETFVPDLVDALETTVVDVDHDGVPDLLTPTVTRLGLRLLRGDPAASWSLVREFSIDTSVWGPALAADLDGSGAAELAIVRPDQFGGWAHVWTSLDADGWRERPDLYTTASPLTGGHFADVTADGALDLVAATGSDDVAVLVGDGLGGFTCEIVLEVAADTSPGLLVTGDLDGDGRLDLVAGVADGKGVTVLRL
ncbi:FG-GAP repeat domain-containing protein [Nannocystis bainbridge]|uniref:VCBS repeat-containing protein n=1 Tax=Nannocystis bainbridge TaxID=2995303 RepID=A0ABT5EB90_9BACT|nr:VCBS repeat-containing protein [Nannocystis bainbridge]MDC0722865.1 VCBS repeat-containing protein [Nannocystis bainbridge]